MSWTVALFVCAIAGAAGLSPQIILPVIVVGLTLASAERVLREVTDRRPTQPTLSCVIALALIGGNALALCAVAYMLAAFARHLTEGTA
jgi:hypothetical protein